jgi:hypothetical protein
MKPNLKFAPTAAHAASRGVDEVCLMKNGIATNGNLSREYFVLQINGRTDSIHRRYEDAVRAGLLLKNQFPHFDIKVREGLTDGERVVIDTDLERAAILWRHEEGLRV